MVNISTEKPLIYKTLKDTFGIDWDSGVIITVGDTIHCKFDLPPFKVQHEVTHTLQQEEMGIDNWWTKYLSDTAFRLDQEIAAYQVEVQWIKDNINDRELKYKLIRQASVDLSSPMYGSIISYEEAKKLIS